MSSRPSTFKEVDIKRAFNAAKIAGVNVARIDIGRDGRISIVPREAAGADEGQKPSGWDEAVGKRA